MKINFLLDFSKSDYNGVVNSALRLSEKLKLEGIKVSINGKGYDYDIIHTHSNFPPTIFKMKKAKRRGLKVISHAHTTFEDLRGSFILTTNDLFLNLFGKYLTYFYSQADLILAPSNWTKNTLINKGIKVPIEVLSNGVDLKKFKYSINKAKEFREKYNLSEEDILVYGLGIVFLRKGIKTFKKVAKELPDLKLFWIGKKHNSFLINHKSINNILKNIPPNLKFLGFVDSKDVLGAHCAGNIFLFPSYVENQGIVILEAAACSKPIILRNLPVYDWAINKGNCLLANNDEEFVNCVDLLSKNKNLRQKLGNSVKKVAEKNDINKTIKNLINIYENAMNF
jgi:1,2-diacylglycerol-3-alpha-glucose alpha-1,2-glucosyltransferase